MNTPNTPGETKSLLFKRMVEALNPPMLIVEPPIMRRSLVRYLGGPLPVASTPQAQAEVKAAIAKETKEAHFKLMPTDKLKLEPGRILMDAGHFVSTRVLAMDQAPEERRGGKHIHGSSLPTLCPRREILTQRAGNRSQVPGSVDRVIWALGRAAEHHVRSQFIRSMEYQGVIGIWSCLCGVTCNSGKYVGETCPKCDAPADQYGELTLVDPATNIQGNPDLLFYQPGSEVMHVVEIKSINRTAFEALTEPIPDHLFQAATYHKLALLSGFNVHKQVTIFYVCKDYIRKPYLSFTVNIPTHIRAGVERAWTSALGLAEWREKDKAGVSQPLPPRLSVCQGVGDTRAKACDQCALCFSCE